MLIDNKKFQLVFDLFAYSHLVQREVAYQISHFFHPEKSDNNIDYYFFTDNKNITSNKWNIIYPLKIPGDEIMDTDRWTSKYIKFKKHTVLKKYDIIVWCDNKILNKSKGFLNYSNIIDTLLNKDLVFLKHPNRKSIQDELIKTIQINFFE